jgi:uncharacterized protein (TIGR00369 family)
MTELEDDLLATLRGINRSAAFNVWAGLEVTAADVGTATLRLPWRDEFGQYTGSLHAGVVTALVDTACGFAAVTVTGGPVTASHCAVNFLAPAVGDEFLARAHVVKAGRRQVFVTAELTSSRDGHARPVATGDTILVPLSPP